MDGFCREKQLRGFSLVEILTVIAVIGVLATLLVLVIGRVRQSAESAGCQSNLRQWHSALMLHVNDNRGRLPLAYDRSATPAMHWNRVLAPYVDRQFANGPFLGTDETIGTCPAHEEDHRYGPTYISYGINIEVTGNDQATGPLSSKRMLNTIDPNRIIFADSVANWHLIPRRLNYRHGGKSHAITVGGTVNSYTANEPPPTNHW